MTAPKWVAMAIALSSAHLLLLLASLASATTFNFGRFRESDRFLFRQSSFLDDGKLSLTRPGIPADHGRVLYPNPIRFKEDNQLNARAVSSFSTTFVFSIEPGLEGLAQGMAFLVAPNSDPVEDSARGYLGLFNKSSNGDPSLHTLAVEFDTYRTPQLLDMDDNHVGVDINSMISAMAASPVFLTRPAFLNSDDGYIVNLKSGHPNQVWIEYDGTRSELNIYISDQPGKKPPYPFLSNSSFDLSAVLLNEMFVGFSASTANLTDICFFVHAWSFSNEGPSPDIIYPAPDSLSDRKTRTLIIAISVGISLAILLSVLLTIIILRMHCRRKKNGCDTMPSLLDETSMSRSTQRFSYKELSRATQGFSKKSLLGRGGFGTVHRGTLLNGTAIAVKLASKESQQGVKEFVAEVSIIGRLRHRNLVPLLGWCPDQRGLALVYEHMPNGSLDTYLFEEKKKKTTPILTWTIRCKILQGVASALVYLHEGWEEKIIHRDVKASNVLLDGEFNARLGDFGLARPSRHGAMTSDTTNVVGTYGYLAPEYMLTRKATEKVDVYSFGALSLEVITGKGIASDISDLPLVDWLWQLHESHRLLEAIDSSLLTCIDCDHDAAVETLRLGLLCLHPDSATRPSMRRALQVLTKDAPLPPMPTSCPPLMSFFSHFPSSISETTTDETSSCPSARDDNDSRQLCR